MESEQLFAHWLEGPEARRISAQLEGCGIGERLWAFAEAYRRAHARSAYSVEIDGAGMMPAAPRSGDQALTA